MEKNRDGLEHGKRCRPSGDQTSVRIHDPRLLFFSGGSAINGLSRKLKEKTWNSIHLVTPFDSGGSSAKLRQAFNMPAIGDLRSRLLALANEETTRFRPVYRFCSYRFDWNGDRASLFQTFKRHCEEKSPLIRDIPPSTRHALASHLNAFLEHMPAGFDLRGASFGNLIIAGGYLNNNRQLEPVVRELSSLLEIRGVARTIVDENYHLLAELADGERVIGQHLLTGKEAPPIRSKICSLQLTSEHNAYQPIRATIRPEIRSLIQSAELICYPPGSFYSSLLANLMPEGVSQAISENACAKVFIPNLGCDPEQFGLSFAERIEILLCYLRKNIEVPVSALLNYILVDEQDMNALSSSDRRQINQLGIELMSARLRSKTQAQYYDDELLASSLVSLCR